MILRWTIRALLTALLAAAVIVGLRTLAATPADPEPGPPIALAADVDAGVLAARLSALLRLRTDGPVDPSGRPALAAFLADHYPLTTDLAVDLDAPVLLYAWPGGAPDRPPVVLLAHLDVVPADAAGMAGWRHAPFAGAIADGEVWGRGALDDKASALTLLEAIESLRRAGRTPERTVYLVLGLDEERGGSGARAAAGWIRQRHPAGLALVLDEGGFIVRGAVPGVSAPVALVGVAEKGYLTLTLTAAGSAGHAAGATAGSPISRIAAAITRLEAAGAPPRLDGPSAWLLERVGPSMSLASRALFANLWLFRPLAARLAATDPRLAPLTTTTMVPTRVEGGVADNVVAPSATATVNVRLLPGDRSEDAVARLRRAIGDPAVRIAVVGPVTEASAVTSPQGAGFVTVEGILRRLAPLREAGVIVAPTLTLASTDARWFADQAASVLRFVPVQASGSQLAGIHGVDERVAVGDLQLAVTFYRALLLALPSLD